MVTPNTQVPDENPVFAGEDTPDKPVIPYLREDQM
jgi:hypothetical protein